jgi:RNA-directed DNA polymerase
MSRLAKVVANTSSYITQPTRRIMIPKFFGSDKLRPISIPTLFDRSVQRLYTMALDPIAIVTSNEQSFGFRKGRGVQDALFTTYLGLTTGNSWPQAIFDADIHQYFPSIPHD